MSTPNMNLTLPIDHNSNDQWGFILSTVFGLIDSHNHTLGQGVKVPSAGLNLNADVTFSPAGTPSAITDLKALDFFPIATSGVVSLAGALFLNSADNELYWRTTTGTNVKLTAGAALNVAAFTGGIGGDYAATGALVIFDDATDSYWFQQQVGSGVRQYARMRSADVDLFEFKANPTAGVPTNRVRLASPTALAASYTLTMPAALPAAKLSVYIDTTGNVTTGASLLSNPIGHSILLAIPGSGVTLNVGTGGSGPQLVLGTSLNASNLPLMTFPGQTLTAWSVGMNKSSASGTLAAKLWRQPSTLAGAIQVGATQTNSAVSPGAIQLGQAGLSEAITDSNRYFIEVLGGGTTGDLVYSYSYTAS